ncbi:acetylornithine deacetylase/succinyl-diaminopimelate desuccinylase-like protein [Actinomadura pelletieri DSM 43383]|uniref:Acetylornithine deacetylase/succinyl-diaminopimelate desuccinylase-like protein n=1 Tax=Actinomadura pelletieri DSM 43383 TaxID=1120940 RepID=A0A495QXX4_9ACTN|nr:M20/M25/M40 family metallo-hydrolase [Actinomadura pelletieri]RKS78983.1 acetylornithine deacetylase/succinyl-diaminopimelate desuccinylase-like protein [Actinomadura pelletieri DSM 43383]
MPSPFAPVEEICSDLIRFDTTNPGGTERKAAEYVASLLTDMGLQPQIIEAEPGRTNVVTRVSGTDPDAPALLVQGHLDTVPADASAWSRHPHSGDIADGHVWGRGAVDMKNAVAMTLAAVGGALAAGRRPRRDLVLAFLADEETGGKLGAGHLVTEHPDLFEGCAAAIGEVGGFNLPIEGGPLFVVSVADKGLRWYEVLERGVAGHGSMIPRDNPIPRLAETTLRLVSPDRPYTVIEPMRVLASRVAGRPVTDPDEVADVLANQTGPFGRMFAAGVQTTVNVTRVGAGYKENVIPGEAWARFDCRFVPGHEDEVDEHMTSGFGDGTEVSLLRRSPSVLSDHESEWFGLLTEALRQESPGCAVAPFVFSGGTDNKWFRTLGMETYGFTPMLLPPDYDYPAMFHGVDERVPVDALTFGVRAMERLISL